MISAVFNIKNMLARSCLKLIELGFTNFQGANLTSLEPGKVELSYDPLVTSHHQIINHLKELGFDLIDNPDQIVVEKIKQAAVELIFYANNTNSLIRNSDYISQKLQLPYGKLSKTFSRVTGTTLEKYLILLKIEKTKEMIVRNQHSISEIAYMLDYSSVQYLSNQFKTIVGVTISEFKENPAKYRVLLEDLLQMKGAV
jgi:AraC-like DNA-binding protein